MWEAMTTNETKKTSNFSFLRRKTNSYVLERKKKANSSLQVQFKVKNLSNEQI